MLAQVPFVSHLASTSIDVENSVPKMARRFDWMTSLDVNRPGFELTPESWT